MIGDANARKALRRSVKSAMLKASCNVLAIACVSFQVMVKFGTGRLTFLPIKFLRNNPSA
jgi:hypothetical protein